MPTDVVMPQMGESVAEGTIVRWIKKVGESIDRDEPLFEISTDKVDAEVPALWQCKCGNEALLVGAARPAPRPAKPARTHWDMLLERRSLAELEVLLDERLELLRAKQGTSHKRSA